MKFEEIKVGMIFKENDPRFERFVQIIKVDHAYAGRDQEGLISMLTSQGDQRGPFEGQITRSSKPSRFHREKKGSGYSLIQEAQ